ncbi:MAG TPA: MMPL family transporter [Solirubrobacterales bacterium]|nr:MMPL family transporter [Solirubrobacterales bacterium]
MGRRRPFGAIAAWSARHARAVLVVAGVIAVAAAVGATQVDTDAGLSTLVGKGDPTYQVTQRARSEFGEEPVVVLVKESLPKLLLGKDLLRLLRLEGCLSGKVPKGAEPLPGACEEIAEMEPVTFLAGPATFLNESVVQIDEQLERLSENLAPAQFREYLLQVATKYGITSAPSIENEEFVATVVFDLAKARGTPKARLAYLFPNSHSAQIVIRLKPDLSESERHRAIGLIKEAVAETTPRKACAEEEGGKPEPCFALTSGSYVVTGAPVLVDAVARALKDALLLLFGVAVVVMAVVLRLAFRSTFRLLPLALALASAALVFGLLTLVGGSLTMASVAVLPILIGLAVDYAIQFQARLDEVQATGATGAEAARTAANLSGPTIATACLATAAGFLVLLLSPTPMVRGFGLLLVAGVLLAFILVMTAGFAALGLRRPPSRQSNPAGGWRRRGDHAEEALATAGMVGPAGDRTRPLASLVNLAIGRPLEILTFGIVLAAIGWGVGTQIDTVSEVRQLAPHNLGAVEDLNTYEQSTGTTGSLEVLVEAPDLTDPATIEWMAAFKRRVLAADDVTAGPALSDFLTRGDGKVTKSGIEATLQALSAYSLRQVAPLDPRTGKVGHVALIAFGISSQTLAEQQQLLDSVRSQVGNPPPGVTVRLAGLPVIAAEAASELSSSRYGLALAGLGAVALVLLVLLRSFRRALVPLLPTVLATGWASLLIWLTGIPLNPMSAALGALTIAIATEFAVILCGRFEQERSVGFDAQVALRRAYARTGAAVLASGLTAIAGFAVLVASDIQMLRDFGAVTVIDLAAALLGVIVILPATLILLERRAVAPAGVGEEPA